MAGNVLNDLDPLNDFDEIGDNSRNYGSDIVDFRSIRYMLEAICFNTELSYIENSSEKNLDELLQIRTIALKWIPNTRTLTHCMIGIVMLDGIRDTISVVASHLQPDEMQRIVTAYSQPMDLPGAVENALYSEYCMAAIALDEIISEGKGGLAHLLFRRNFTLNIYSRYIEEQIAFSRLQDWESMLKLSGELEKDFERFHPMNWGGWTFLAMAVPAMGGVFQRAYESESKDLELIEKLQPDK